MKKLSLVLVIAISAFFTAICNAQYNWHAIPNAPTSWRFDDIYFLNPNMGWAIHANYDYLTPSQEGQVYKTWDGGNHWTLMHDSGTAYYRCVGFIDSLHGWVGNLADPSVTKDSTHPMYYTADGGRTLTPVNFPNPKPKGICGITVINDTVIYAYGRFIGSSIVAKTTNAGATWTTQDLSSQASVGLIDAYFLSKDTGFITGQNGNNAVILHTNDGGTTWQNVYTSTRNDTDHVWKIFFPSRDTGYGSIEYLGNNFNNYNAYFIKTTDGGKTWIEHPFVSTYDEEGIGFINNNVGWIGGAGDKPNYKTTDGGNTWAVDSSFGVVTPPYMNSFNYEFDINRFRKFGDTLMYASGNTIYKLNTGITGQKELHYPASNALKNYPNPFSGETTIEYTLPLLCHHVKLIVYNCRGEVVSTKELGTQIAGLHTIPFMNQLSSGGYFYKIISDEFTATQKMLSVK